MHALSFPGGGRSHGGSDPSPHNNSPIQLCVMLDNDKEDPEHAILCFNKNEMSGGGDETARKTMTVSPPPARTSLSPKAQALLVNPTFTALLKMLAGIRFWNDSLQDFKLGLNFCHLVRKVVGLGPNEIMQEAPEGVERFADDDGMKQIIGVRKYWPIPDSKGFIGFALTRANTHFERHETSALLNVHPGLFDGKYEKENGRLGCFFAPTLNLGALMRSSEDNDGQQFAPFAIIAMSASESICLVKQQQHKGESVLLRFIQKGVLSTGKLPRYASNLNGHAARVRDYNERAVFETNGSSFWEYASIPPVSSYFQGSIELQIPTTSILQRSFAMVFGDVSFARGICRRAGGEEKMVSRFDNIIRKSCIGVAIYRLPFRFGISYSENGRAGVTFGFVDSSGY